MDTEKNIQKEPKVVDLQKAFIVADRVSLQGIRLIQSECLLKPAGCKGPYDIKIDSDVNIQVNNEKKNIAVIAHFHLKAFVKDTKKEEPDFNISASFVLSYNIDSFEGIEKECIQAFGEANGLYNAWPYWREFVQNISTRMGLPSLIMPVFRLAGVEKKETTQNADNNTPKEDAEKKKNAKRKKKV